jgi:primase-polymerase (primpol)-like protein
MLALDHFREIVAVEEGQYENSYSCLTDAGTFSPLAAEIIGYGECYAEVSPSGAGIRIFARGKIDKAVKDDKLGVEVYATGRYLTITGNQVDGMPAEIRPAPQTLDMLRAVVQKARKVERQRLGQMVKRAPPARNFSTM